MRLISLIKNALDEVPQDYYHISTTYCKEGIVRERVFCYELYHRMRKIQDDNKCFQFHIHGEIDKSGHKLFARKDRKNPDFIFHDPGRMEGNALIVEVKGTITVQGVSKDLETLKAFCSKYGYQQGLWILFNYNLEEAKRKLRNKIRNMGIEKYYDVAERITILCKKAHGERSEQINMSNLLAEIRG